MKRFAMIISMVLLLVLGTLVGCTTDEVPQSTVGSDSSQNTTEEELVTVKYMTYTASPDHLDTLESMINDFKAKNSNIDVEYEGVPFSDYFTKLQVSIAGNQAPDIFETNLEVFPVLSSKDAMYNLDELIKNDTAFDPAIYSQSVYEAYQYNNIQYGLPSSFSTVITFYNKDLFDTTGVAYPDNTWTWEDEVKAGKALTNSENSVWGIYSPVQFWEFYKTAAQNGGSLIDNQGNVTINTKENIEALEYMLSLVNDGYCPSDAQMSGQSDSDLFLNGQLAMLTTGIWMFGAFEEAPFNWDIAVEPGNVNNAHHLFANGVSISSESEYPEKAWEFIKFFTGSQEATTTRVEASWELPPVTDQEALNSYLEQSPPQSREKVFEALENVVLPPATEQWNEMVDIVNLEISVAKLGEKTAEEALNDAQVKVEELFSQK